MPLHRVGRASVREGDLPERWSQALCVPVFRPSVQLHA